MLQHSALPRPKDWSARLNAVSIQHLSGFTCRPTQTCWHGRNHSLLVYLLEAWRMEAGNVYVHFLQGTFFAKKSIKSTFRIHEHCILKTLTNILNDYTFR